MTYLIVGLACFIAGVLFEVVGMGTRIRTALANAIRPKAATIPTPDPKAKKI